MMALDCICKVSEEMIFRIDIPEVLWSLLLRAGFLWLQTAGDGASLHGLLTVGLSLVAELRF